MPMVPPMTLPEALYYGSLGLFAILVGIVWVAALTGFWYLLRNEVWPDVVRIVRLWRRWRMERRLWREHRKSKLARALRDQVVTRRER
jgi:hypothetical protein